MRGSNEQDEQRKKEESRKKSNNITSVVNIHRTRIIPHRIHKSTGSAEWDLSGTGPNSYIWLKILSSPPSIIPPTPFRIHNFAINSAARSAAIIIPICGFTVNGATIDPSTTCRFFIPTTTVFASTHDPNRQELDQWFTCPRA